MMGATWRFAPTTATPPGPPPGLPAAPAAPFPGRFFLLRRVLTRRNGPPRSGAAAAQDERAALVRQPDEEGRKAVTFILENLFLRGCGSFSRQLFRCCATLG